MKDTVRLFWENLKLSWIAAVPQEHQRPQIILNFSAQPDNRAPSVNETTVREIAPESMKFVHAFPRILQAIWEVDPVQGLVIVSTLDVTDAYPYGTLRLAQVEYFVYVVLATAKVECVIICIDLVLPMAWVD